MLYEKNGVPKDVFVINWFEPIESPVPAVIDAPVHPPVVPVVIDALDVDNQKDAPFFGRTLQ